MTTIAWDGELLASDRRVTYGTISDARVTKIGKTKKGLCGAAGVTSICAAFRRWFMEGEKGDPPFMGKDGDAATGFIIRPNGVRFMYDQFGWYEVDPGPFAMGSGYEIALGAMRQGSFADKAVQIAAEFDGSTGNEVDMLRL